ncbi:MAG: hypothetical protein KDD48_05825 [Bdellovibrionales bacterium]|nr:hypothetical protein [Bdellovibrionales bacterium]
MVNQELLKLLVCPQCKGEVIYREDEQAIDCVICKLRFPVEDDIPMILLGKASVIE